METLIGSAYHLRGIFINQFRRHPSYCSTLVRRWSCTTRSMITLQTYQCVIRVNFESFVWKLKAKSWFFFVLLIRMRALELSERGNFIYLHRRHKKENKKSPAPRRAFTHDLSVLINNIIIKRNMLKMLKLKCLSIERLRLREKYYIFSIYFVLHSLSPSVRHTGLKPFLSLFYFGLETIQLSKGSLFQITRCMNSGWKPIWIRQYGFKYTIIFPRNRKVYMHYKIPKFF